MGSEANAAGIRGAGTLETRYRWQGALLIAPTVLIFCLVIVYPLVSAIYLSLFSI